MKKNSILNLFNNFVGSWKVPPYPFATALSAAFSLRVKIRQNPQIPTGIKTATTMAEVMPAFRALYFSCAVMKKTSIKMGIYTRTRCDLLHYYALQCKYIIQIHSAYYIKNECMNVDSNITITLIELKHEIRWPE